jgi:hypothetical protein
MHKENVARRILAGTLLGLGVFGLLVAGLFLVWLREWDPLGMIFAFWYVVIALACLSAGWIVLRWDRKNDPGAGRVGRRP